MIASEITFTTYTKTTNLNLSLAILILLVILFLILQHLIFLSSTAKTIVARLKKCTSLCVKPSAVPEPFCLLNNFFSHTFLSFCFLLFLHTYLIFALSCFASLYIKHLFVCNPCTPRKEYSPKRQFFLKIHSLRCKMYKFNNLYNSVRV